MFVFWFLVCNIRFWVVQTANSGMKQWKEIPDGLQVQVDVVLSSFLVLLIVILAIGSVTSVDIQTDHFTTLHMREG